MINNNLFAAALIASSLLLGGCATFDYQKPSPTKIKPNKTGSESNTL